MYVLQCTLKIASVRDKYVNKNKANKSNKREQHSALQVSTKNKSLHHNHEMVPNGDTFSENQAVDVMRIIRAVNR